MIIRVLLKYTALRRVVTVSLLAACSACALALLPIGLVLGGLGMLRPGARGRPARFSAFAAVYLAAEIVGLGRALWLRVRWAPRGNDRRGEKYAEAHYVLLDRLLSWLCRAARLVFRLRVLPPMQLLEVPNGPLLVFSRHAGPGDSFLLVYALLAAVRRRPRVVLKQTLALDPLIDVVLSRTPNCFVGADARGRAAATERIARLSGSLGPHDALLVFPEGGNFTAARRSRLIERLRRRRDWRLLPTARSLEHVLPPQPTGVFAAIDAAAPGTTLVFVAHTGLDRLETAADVWRAVPLSRPLQVAWWSVPLTEAPAPGDETARAAWLAEHWAKIDSWISEHRERDTHETGPPRAADPSRNRNPL
jgi:hypothetical protein